ncbi:hypothetical protein HNR15_002586 [Allobranchiibius huperziae]|uniref:Uncharacterized protein n=2 Tax=Allobranchiibius huperziae TaxID=1874116 RepID=A0A853DHX3_9MICO|nr:hypothetical protein [Allobranchiibius huperziae]
MKYRRLCQFLGITYNEDGTWSAGHFNVPRTAAGKPRFGFNEPPVNSACDVR